MTANPTIGPDALGALEAQVHGRVVRPSAPDWAHASLAWSLVPQEPLAVVEAANVADVVETVRWAQEHGVAVAAQPGGHGATGAASGAVLLRTAALDDVAVDAEARVARVGAGVKWGAFLPALDGTGLLALAGSNPDVTVVGYLLGGGMSWFSRLQGFAAHTLRAAEVVDADGRLRRVDDRTDPEVMWALRGGGGDLVVVTEVEIDLIPAAGLYGGKLTFPIADAAAVLEAFVDATHDSPDELSLWATLVHFPDVEMLPEPLRGQSFVTVDATYVGPPDRGAALLDPIRAAGTLIGDTTAEIPIGRLGEVADEPTDPTPSIDWSSFLTDISKGTVSRLLAVTADPARTALNMVQIRHVGGGLSDPPAPVPAVADRVASSYVAGAFGFPMVPELVEPIRASLANLAGALGPEVSADRLPLNFLGAGESLSRAFDDATLARLRALKRAIDPSGTVRGNFPLLAG